jgi:hypothetical protein
MCSISIFKWWCYWLQWGNGKTDERRDTLEELSRNDVYCTYIFSQGWRLLCINLTFHTWLASVRVDSWYMLCLLITDGSRVNCIQFFLHVFILCSCRCFFFLKRTSVNISLWAGGLSCWFDSVWFVAFRVFLSYYPSVGLCVFAPT